MRYEINRTQTNSKKNKIAEQPGKPQHGEGLVHRRTPNLPLVLSDAKVDTIAVQHGHHVLHQYLKGTGRAIDVVATNKENNNERDILKGLQ